MKSGAGRQGTVFAGPISARNMIAGMSTSRGTVNLNSYYLLHIALQQSSPARSAKELVPSIKLLRMEHSTSHIPLGPGLDHPPIASLIHLHLDLVAPTERVGLHKLPSGFRFRTGNLPPLFVHTLNGTKRLVEALASREICSAAPDMQAQETAAQSGFTVRGELGGVDVDGEG